jgi:shikimate 5-dehydrogenase
MKTVLIGWPIGDSISPAIHNAAFQALGMNGEYALGGLGMVVEQGALAFELWTATKAPRDVMMRAAKEAFA